MDTEENFVITYGCPPTEGVPAKSTIAHAYLKYLKKAADSQGNIALPGPLNFFVGADGKCEHSIKVRKPLLLKWQDKTALTASESMRGTLETLSQVTRKASILKKNISIQ